MTLSGQLHCTCRVMIGASSQACILIRVDEDIPSSHVGAWDFAGCARRRPCIARLTTRSATVQRPCVDMIHGTSPPTGTYPLGEQAESRQTRVRDYARTIWQFKTQPFCSSNGCTLHQVVRAMARQWQSRTAPPVYTYFLIAVAGVRTSKVVWTEITPPLSKTNARTLYLWNEQSSGRMRCNQQSLYPAG